MRTAFLFTYAGLLAVTVSCGVGLDTESVAQVAEEATVCGVGPTVPGIDVSYYQGKPDWTAVANSGMRFAITRINDGDFMDPEFTRNYKLIHDVGMVRGAYQFFRSTKDAIAFADLTIQKIGKLGPGDMSPVLDVEATNNATPEEMTAKITTWVEHVEEITGRKPMIYTGKYFWNDNVKTTTLKNYPMWHAQYSSVKCPDIAAAWSNWAIWQYTSSGMTPGISGNVDTNRLNGDELRLQDMAANGYRASIVSLDYPKSLEAGHPGTVELVLKNEGARTWTEKTHLGTTEKRDHESALAAPTWLSPTRVLAIEGEVKSGATVKLSFSIIAPGKPGPLVEHFNLVEEGIAWFSELVPGGGPLDTELALVIEVTPSMSTSASTGGGGGGGGGDSEASAGGAVAAGIPDRGVAVSASCSLGSPPRGSDESNSKTHHAAGILFFALAWLRAKRHSKAKPPGA